MGTILGITDIDNHGQFGLELQYNQKLQGKPTTFKLKKDAKAHHFYFSKEMTQEGIQGTPLTITIDANLQHKLHQILENTAQKIGSTEGGAIVLDPFNGDILAAVSFPSFNPQKNKEFSMEETKCRPISNCFEFGSVIKTFAALAALQEGIVTLEEEIDCENTKETYIDKLRVRTVTPSGKITFKKVMQDSNNIGVVKTMKKLGQDLYDYYKMLGFGQTTGLHFPGEQKGFVNHPSNWSSYSIQSLSYGYEITASLLQLAQAFSMIVNEGYLVKPRLIKDQPIIQEGPFLSIKTINDIKELLLAIVQEHGARRAKIPNYITYGKTGTAHILENGKYNENKHLYSFVGAVEKDGYKRVIACYLKDSAKKSYGSFITAPLFKELAEALIIHDNV